MEHVSVLSQEVMQLLVPKAGETVLDVTVGLGGHAALFSTAIKSNGRLICLDADKENLDTASANVKNATLLHSNFRDLGTLDLPMCDVIFADLGLSSPHLDDPSRGFSFRHHAPLDLRFDRSSGITAAELIASIKEEELANIFKDYGEVKGSYKLARLLKQNCPTTTQELSETAEKALGWQYKKILPQIFQALRIAVNNEMGALDSLLEIAPSLLSLGGRLGIISFHSLEDRAVKQAFKSLTTPEKDPITGQDLPGITFELLTKKPITPSDDEIRRNPRSRSAKLRCIKRIST